MGRLPGKLIPLYRQVHEAGKYYRGNSTLRKYVNDISQIIREIETGSILDYGCGKGLQYTEDRLHKPWGIMPTLFDPAVSGIDELPEGQFDGVICTGVLEHIPQDELQAAIDNLSRYARKWAFLAIGISPAHKTLPNGQNAHVIVKPPEWWKQRLEPAFNGGAELHLRFVSR